MPGPQWSAGILSAIDSRQANLTEIQGIAGQMSDFLEFVKKTARDETGENYHPWIYTETPMDGTNADEAIDVWNNLKAELQSKVAALP